MPQGSLGCMSTLTIDLDDGDAELVQAAARVVNQPLERWVRESICQVAKCTLQSTRTAVRRISPLHPGAMQPTPSFDEPLQEFAPYV